MPPSGLSNSQAEGYQLSDLTSSVETNTPRELSSRLRILEIYTLHVLPANGEWNYAKEFIEMNDLLDEERKEAFLQTLQSLQDEVRHDARREEELQKQREQQLEHARRREAEEEATRQAQVAKAELQQEQKSKETRPSSQKSKVMEHPELQAPSKAGAVQKPTTKPSSTMPSKAIANTNTPRPGKKPKAPPASLYKRASSTLAAIQNTILAMGHSLRSNPMALFRMVLFTIAMVTALAQRDVRDKITRAKDAAFAKIKATASMGMKVSYV